MNPWKIHAFVTSLKFQGRGGTVVFNILKLHLSNEVLYIFWQPCNLYYKTTMLSIWKQHIPYLLEDLKTLQLLVESRKDFPGDTG